SKRCGRLGRKERLPNFGIRFSIRRRCESHDRTVPKYIWRMLGSLFLRTFLLAVGLANIAVAAERPNIVLILSVDQACTDYGFMGHPDIATPNLDRLAAESLVFPRGYVASPLCRPSLASMVTGQSPHVHGVTGNDV